MSSVMRSLLCTVTCALLLLTLSGCANDVRSTKKITTHEEGPVRTVSPGTEIVE